MTDGSDLAARAQAISERLVSVPQDRPVFVEFAGTPKSGKSSCIEIVRHFFRRSDIKVLAPAEGASRRTPYFLKDDLMAFNTWSASYALMHVLEGLHGSDQYDLAILDRGLFDALAWFELLASQGLISPEDRDGVQRFLQIDHWRSNIDAVFLFTTDPETSMDRENRDKLIDEPGQAMNPDFLHNLNTAYGDVRQRFADKFTRLIPIDTSDSRNTSPTSTAAEVADVILNVFDGRLSNDEEMQS